MELLWFLLIGLIAGWLAGMVMKSNMGLIGDMIVGVVGALIGGYLFTKFGVSSGGGLLGAIIVAFVGAVLLLFIIRLIRRG